jgi:hypothetical protein
MKKRRKKIQRSLMQEFLYKHIHIQAYIKYMYLHIQIYIDVYLHRDEIHHH